MRGCKRVERKTLYCVHIIRKSKIEVLREKKVLRGKKSKERKLAEYRELESIKEIKIENIRPIKGL